MVDHGSYAIAMGTARRCKERAEPGIWIDIVQAARQITMDQMDLDDLPAVALAITRADRLRRQLNSAIETV